MSCLWWRGLGREQRLISPIPAVTCISLYPSLFIIQLFCYCFYSSHLEQSQYNKNTFTLVQNLLACPQGPTAWALRVTPREVTYLTCTSTHSAEPEPRPDVYIFLSWPRPRPRGAPAAARSRSSWSGLAKRLSLPTGIPSPANRVWATGLPLTKMAGEASVGAGWFNTQT